MAAIPLALCPHEGGADTRIYWRLGPRCTSSDHRTRTASRCGRRGGRGVGFYACPTPRLRLSSRRVAFRIESSFKPTGDQPRAIRELSEGLRRGDRHQVLLGVTGSGKTFTVANVVAEVQRATLVIAHN